MHFPRLVSVAEQPKPEAAGLEFISNPAIQGEGHQRLLGALRCRLVRSRNDCFRDTECVAETYDIGSVPAWRVSGIGHGRAGIEHPSKVVSALGEFSRPAGRSITTA